MFDARTNGGAINSDSSSGHSFCSPGGAKKSRVRALESPAIPETERALIRETNPHRCKRSARVYFVLVCVCVCIFMSLCDAINQLVLAGRRANMNDSFFFSIFCAAALKNVSPPVRIFLSAKPSGCQTHEKSCTCHSVVSSTLCELRMRLCAVCRNQLGFN